MKAYILPSAVTIYPFADPVSQSMIGSRTLAQRQDRVLEQLGFEVERIDGPERIKENSFLLTYDDVFFTRRVLRSLVEQGRKAKGSVRCGLPYDSLLVQKTLPLQDVVIATEKQEKLALYRLYWVQEIAPSDSQERLTQSLSQARPVRVLFKEKIIRVPTPKHIMGSGSYDHPLTSSVVMHIGHWVHLLWVNQLWIQIRWIETILNHPVWVFSKLLGGAGRALVMGRWGRSAFKWSLFSRFNRLGKGCDIHPTARIEFSQLGNNVKIGAFSLVRGSLLGDGVTVEERANLLYSVIGDNCFVSKNSKLTLCASYPDSDLCAHGIQCSLFGTGCALTSFARAIDLKPRGEIRVEHQSRLHSVGTNFLGACFGHGCFVGMDVTVQAGRMVPNRAMLVKPPATILSDIPADLPPGVPAWVEDGKAVPAPPKRS